MGHEVLSLVQGVGRAILSYPEGVGHPILLHRWALIQLLYKTQAAGFVAKILTNLLSEKIQKVTGRTSIWAWNPLLTFFFGSNEHVL